MLHIERDAFNNYNTMITPKPFQRIPHFLKLDKRVHYTNQNGQSLEIPLPFPSELTPTTKNQATKDDLVS